MLRNILRTAVRAIWKHKGHAALNIAGLAVGIACALLVALYIRHEMSYDRFHERADRIYRVTYEAAIEGNVNHSARSAPPMAGALEETFPEIETAARLIVDLYSGGAETLVEHGSTRFVEDDVYFADPSILEVLTLPFAFGDAATALSEPGTVVISAPLAEKIFGTADAVGETLTLHGSKTYRVTGVLEPIPEASHLPIDALASSSTLEADFGPQLESGWFWVAAYTYVLLREDAGIGSVEERLTSFYDTHMAVLREQYSAGIHFQPLTDIHLHSRLQAEAASNGNIRYLYIFGLIGAFIVVIACFNYINLSTARFSRRAREVGLRKSLGAGRLQLAVQFFAETSLNVIIALTLAAAMARLAVPVVERMLGVEMMIPSGAALSATVAAIALVVAFLAGTYPAVYLSKFDPIRVLKGTIRAGRGAVNIRRILTVGQFALTILIVIGTLVAIRQLQFMRHQGLGFEKENLIAIRLHEAQNEAGIARLKRAVEDIPTVSDAAFATSVPGGHVGRTVFYRDARGAPETQLLPYVYVDEDFTGLMDIKIVEGRGFSRERGTDRQAVVVNQAAVRHFGWTDPIGKRIRRGKTASGSYLWEGEVIGVVEDFHVRSLHDVIEPTILLFGTESASDLEAGYVVARIAPSSAGSALRALDDVWQSFDADHPLDFVFVDELFDRQYRSDERVAALFKGLTALALFIAFLGLAGLAAFTAERRRREIGVRKVLGATTRRIVAMLSRDVALLVVAAFVIATPPAYLGAREWLSDFAYRTEVSWWIFALAGGGALVFACLIVSVQSLRAALSDPVKAIRHE